MNRVSESRIAFAGLDATEPFWTQMGQCKRDPAWADTGSAFSDAHLGALDSSKVR